MSNRLLALSLTALLLTACGASMPAGPRAKVAGQPASRAAEAFYDLDGRPASLASFKGKRLVVSFLAPGQPDSEAQLPIVIRLADAYAAEGVRWLIAGERAAPAALKAWAAGNDLAFPVWEDRGAREWQRRGFTSLPAHEFRRADGGVAARRDGFMSRGELLEQLEALD